MADLAATAHLLARWPAADRPALLDRLLSQAQAADCFCRRFHRPHPLWGDGSLLSRTLADTVPSRFEDDDYWASLGLVVLAISNRKRAARQSALGLCDARPIC